MTLHLYKCRDCGYEVDVRAVEGVSEAPTHPPLNVEDDNRAHEMKRSWAIAGAWVKW